MKRKPLWKALGAGMLALTLALSPAADLSAQAAAPAPAEQKTGDKTEGLASGDTAEIPVWGFTGILEGATVYSVDVEWGAMTFQYVSTTGSNNVWDPGTHSYSSGGTTKQWYVYDGATKSIADSEQTAINQISVINHSNAAVKATFSYQSEGQYSAVTGQFTAGTGTDFTTNVMNLATADNNKGDQGHGKEVTGKVYFMPSGSMTGTSGGSETPTWEQLGKITVAIDAATP